MSHKLSIMKNTISLTLSTSENYSQNHTYMYGVVKPASFSVRLDRSLHLFLVRIRFEIFPTYVTVWNGLTTRADEQTDHCLVYNLSEHIDREAVFFFSHSMSFLLHGIPTLIHPFENHSLWNLKSIWLTVGVQRLRDFLFVSGLVFRWAVRLKLAFSTVERTEKCLFYNLLHSPNVCVQIFCSRSWRLLFRLAPQWPVVSSTNKDGDSYRKPARVSRTLHKHIFEL